MKNISKNAFTIAETLIALLVLGILASLLLPVINTSFERNVIQSNFADIIKETNKMLFSYSVNMQNRNCRGDLTCTDLFTNTNNNGNAAQTLASGLSTGFSGNNCWNNIRIKNNLDGSGASTDLSNFSCFNMNGKIYATQTLSNCSTNLYIGNAGARNKLQHSCGYLFVDINGTKAPNTFGRDVFIFVITNSAPTYLYPIGGQLLNNAAYNNVGNWQNSCANGSQDGRTCAGRIVEEGMKVRYL